MFHEKLLINTLNLNKSVNSVKASNVNELSQETMRYLIVSWLSLIHGYTVLLYEKGQFLSYIFRLQIEPNDLKFTIYC